MTMLRCRKCRKGFVDSSCLYPVEEAEESSAPACSIWHVNVDALPEWILTSVQQAQWTVGKLNCQNCGARLGSFNFVSRVWCPCGRETAVHLSKSRVDLDRKHCVHIAQPRGAGRAGPWTDGSQNKDERSDGWLEALRLNCAAQTEPSHPLSDGEAAQSFSFSPLYCLSHTRRCSLEDDTPTRVLCLCPANPVRTPASETARGRAEESALQPVKYPIMQQAEEAGGSAVEQQERPDEVQTSAVSSDVHQDVMDPETGPNGSDVPEQEQEEEEEEEMLLHASSPAAYRQSRREKNRLKGLRRKQRRKERWVHSRLEKKETGGVSFLLTDSEDEDREGFTCAVCLDVFFSPHSCQPCGHVFCEPCLRTLAVSRPNSTPCPLCRTLVTHTRYDRELDQTVESFFPKLHHSRKQSFKKDRCASWPLPSSKKRFRAFWANRRQPSGLALAFSLETLDLNDIRGWIFDMVLVIVYINSVHWVLGLLFLSSIMYLIFG
ncbi:E3 ubiquitin-protein ligase RNF180 [Genypterus blacodes]|uniref:E3 ubiquitin-protein ligase RNF180 n=1 Tax=Genypterus blacodes TaxID=154954 RepID=UPI003F76ED47